MIFGRIMRSPIAWDGQCFLFLPPLEEHAPCKPELCIVELQPDLIGHFLTLLGLSFTLSVLSLILDSYTHHT